jgi:hypothetical protein
MRVIALLHVVVTVSWLLMATSSVAFTTVPSTTTSTSRLSRNGNGNAVRPFSKEEKEEPRSRKTRLFMSTRTGRDFYQILGVARNADAKQIKAAYRNLAKQYHPGT